MARWAANNDVDITSPKTGLFSNDTESHLPDVGIERHRLRMIQSEGVHSLGEHVDAVDDLEVSCVFETFRESSGAGEQVHDLERSHRAYLATEP